MECIKEIGGEGRGIKEIKGKGEGGEGL